MLWHSRAWRDSTKRLLTKWKEDIDSESDEPEVDAITEVGVNAAEEESHPSSHLPSEEPTNGEENTVEVDAVTEESHSSPNLNGVSLPRVLRKRRRPKGSNKSVIGLPKKRFRI